MKRMHCAAESGGERDEGIMQTGMGVARDDETVRATGVPRNTPITVMCSVL